MKKTVRPKTKIEKAKKAQNEHPATGGECKDNQPLVRSLDSSYEARVEEYLSPEFTQRLLEHMNSAVQNALPDCKENKE